MFATLSPQEAVNRGLPKPSECDLTVVILWSRMGTPLSEPLKPDGTRYLSGTEWEYADAVRAGKEVLVYRRTTKVTVDIDQIDDPEVQEQLRQKKLVGRFFEQFAGPDGTLTGGVTSYEQPDELAVRLEQDVEWYLRETGTASPATQGKTGQPPAPEVPASYLKWLQKQCASVELLGLRLKKGQSVRLSNVYVPVTTTATQRADPDGSAESLPRPDRVQHEVTPLVGRLGETSLYVSGDPGSGKSTLCRWVAWLAGEGEVPAADLDLEDELIERWPDGLCGRLPLLVSLREFWEVLASANPTAGLSGAELTRLLAAWVDRKGPGGLRGAVLEAHLACGSALLILDGVDEVPTAHRALLIAGLSEAASTWTANGNRLLVTSRPYGLTDGDIRSLGLPHAPIRSLVPPLQQALVRLWFRILQDDKEVGDAVAGEMLRQVNEQDWLSPLVANPLLLTAMCIVYGEGKRLPQDKYELYDRIVDTVLHNRIADPAEVARVRDRLSVVAYGMHTGSDLGETRGTPHAQTTDTELDRLLRAYQERSTWTENVKRSLFEAREELVSRTGLLVPQGEHRAGFYHLSFQEFLAAQRLADLEADRLFDAVVERAPVREWRNTLSFLFGQVLAQATSPDRAVGLLGRLSDHVQNEDTPARVVMADWIEILQGRGYGLGPEAHQCAVDLCLTSIRGDAPAVDRCELGTALGRLGDPRFRADAWFLPDDPLLGFVEVPAGSFRMGSEENESGAFDDETPRHELTLPPYLIGRFPVTVAQFRAFVEDRGQTSEQPESLRGPGNHPVVHVTWHEAIAYCRWLTTKLGASNDTPPELRRLVRGDGIDRPWQVMLPSEAEWEKAARGTDARVYPWGNNADPERANYDDTRIGGTSAVGCFPAGASPYGVEGLSGNVEEWTRTLWGKDLFEPEFGYPYEPSGKRENLTAPDDVHRVLRGGAFYLTEGFVRAARRRWDYPHDRDFSVGFRVVVSPFFSEL
jgi:formylglycine-generating enzyme required for sulfatase activity